MLSLMSLPTVAGRQCQCCLHDSQLIIAHKAHHDARHRTAKAPASNILYMLLYSFELKVKLKEPRAAVDFYIYVHLLVCPACRLSRSPASSKLRYILTLGNSIPSQSVCVPDGSLFNSIGSTRFIV
jgi:hypothetical protein